MTLNNRTSHDQTPDARFLAVAGTIEQAAARYARRFRVERLREEIHAEAVARVVELIDAGRTPFHAPSPDDAGRERLRQFTTGLVANVAREALRGDLRQSRPARDPRTQAAAALESAGHPPSATIELRETIARAMKSLRDLDDASRLTLVAEESMRNEYQPPQIRRLSQACAVPFEEVMGMIELKASGGVSAEAWRQRVHRSRKRARSLLGAAAALLIALTLGSPLAAPAASGDPAAATILADDSTQNGKKGKAPAATLASTQNGSKKSAGFENLLASTQNGKKRGALRA